MSPGIRALGIFAVIAALAAAPPAPARAAGSSSPSTTSENAPFEKAKAAVEANDYRLAVTLFEGVIRDQPGNADALNYLGYSHRRLGEFTQSLAFYQRALAADPKHRGANAYLGELYLQMGEVGRAEEQLKRLDGLCLFGCSEYDRLKAALEEHRKKKSG